MAIKLKIEGRAQEARYLDTYELVVGYEHGDADGYTSRRYFYSNTCPEISSNVDDLKEDLEVLLVMCERYDPRDIFNDSKNTNLTQYFTEIGKENPKAAALEFLDAFYEADITYEGYSAKPFVEKVFYYDAFGDKHNVSYSTTIETE